MNTYKVKFTATLIGAIGKPQIFTKKVQGENFDDVKMQLYTHYEHIIILSINGKQFSCTH